MLPDQDGIREHKNRLLKYLKTLTRLKDEREDDLVVSPVSHHSFIRAEISALKAAIYSLHRMREGIVMPRPDDNESA